jgi:hypothetical protein
VIKFRTSEEFQRLKLLMVVHQLGNTVCADATKSQIEVPQ